MINDYFVSSFLTTGWRVLNFQIWRTIFCQNKKKLIFPRWLIFESWIVDILPANLVASRRFGCDVLLLRRFELYWKVRRFSRISEELRIRALGQPKSGLVTDYVVSSDRPWSPWPSGWRVQFVLGWIGFVTGAGSEIFGFVEYGGYLLHFGCGGWVRGSGDIIFVAGMCETTSGGITR